MLRRLFRYLRKSRLSYEPLIEVRISKSRLLHNLAELQKVAPGGQVAPVLKSNAYGHGLIPVAKILDTQAIPFLVVDSYFEALTLRTEKIKSPILIIGYSHIKNILTNHLHDISFTITSLEQLKELSTQITRPTIFHLKIDTGMNRQGVRIEELTEALSLLSQNKHILLEGICSHFANAASTDNTFTDIQITRWNNAVSTVKKSFPNLRYWHLSATSGHAYAESINANVSRSGIGLYGIVSQKKLERTLNLQPVLSMHSIIGSIKKATLGETVGYELLYRTKKDTLLATIPAGYYEGIDKRLTNKGFVLVQNIPCPIVGRVSMNITTIDVSVVKDINRDTEVILISNTSNDPNSASAIATLCDTSAYEIFVHIPAHLRRKIVS